MTGAVQKRVLRRMAAARRDEQPLPGEQYVWWTPRTDSERGACQRLRRRGVLASRSIGQMVQYRDRLGAL